MMSLEVATVVWPLLSPKQEEVAPNNCCYSQ